jgi:hypothetical protein
MSYNLPEDGILTIRQCADIMDHNQRLTDAHYTGFTDDHDHLQNDVEKRLNSHIKEIKEAIKNKTLAESSKGYPWEDNYEDGGHIHIQDFYDWIIDKEITLFGDLNNDIFNLCEKLEYNYNLDLFSRRKKVKKRRINEEYLQEYMRDTLWNLAEALMVLDDFKPYTSNTLNIDCIKSDKKLSRYYQNAKNAFKINTLELINESTNEWEEIIRGHGDEWVEKIIHSAEERYLVRPDDLIQWLENKGIELPLLGKLKPACEISEDVVKYIKSNKRLTALIEYISRYRLNEYYADKKDSHIQNDALTDIKGMTTSLANHIDYVTKPDSKCIGPKGGRPPKKKKTN